MAAILIFKMAAIYVISNYICPYLSLKSALSTRRMVEILQKFIKTESIGDWQLHLHALSEMLPFFAVAGHFHYAKSARFHLQSMQSLDTIHPGVYQNFMSGLHVIHRSDGYWVGLSTDLVIEQVSMRSLKTIGGLTRGTGISETQRLCCCCQCLCVQK